VLTNSRQGRAGSWRPARAWIPLLTVLLGWILACSSDDPTEPPPPPPDGPTIKQVVESTGWFPAVSPDSNAWALARFDSTSGGGDPWVCTDFDGAETRVFDLLGMLAPDPSVLYPGGIVQWASLDGLAPLPVLADRSGGAVTLSTPAGGLVEGEVAAVGPAELAAWRTGALAELGEVAPGLWELSAGVVYNVEHLAVVTGLGPSGMTAEAWERLAFTEGATGHVLVTLRRVHHTVSCPYPGSSTLAFADHVTGEDIEDQMAPGNPPVWVPAVDYGQQLYVLVEAEAEPAEVLAAAVNTFAAAAENRSPDAGVPVAHELPGVSMSALALGADSDAAEAACAAGLPELRDFLLAGPGEADALPGISAPLEALRNGGPLQRAATASFEFTSCEVYEPVFDQVYWAFSAANARTTWVDGDLESDGEGRYRYDGGTSLYTERVVDFIPDLVGGGGNAAPPGDSRRPFFIADAVGGRPAVELYELTLPDGYLFSELRFDGSALAGNDYTVFIVLGMPHGVRISYTTPGGVETIPMQNQVNYFFHGIGSGTRNNLIVGFFRTGPIQRWMKYEHTSYLVQVAQPEIVGWHVCALRFGVNSGMTLFWDGEIPEGGHDPSDTFPLRQFTGATFCSRWQSEDTSMATVWLAEIIAYRGAGSDQMVLAEVARLQQKYGLAP
jgi:hypothetical protein